MAAGVSIRAGNGLACAVGIVVMLLLRWQAMSVAERQAQDWRVFLRILIFGFMALFLRGGALALFQRSGGAPPLFTFSVCAPRRWARWCYRLPACPPPTQSCRSC